MSTRRFDPKPGTYWVQADNDRCAQPVCGHSHKTPAAALRCRAKLAKLRPRLRWHVMEHEPERRA